MVHRWRCSVRKCANAGLLIQSGTRRSHAHFVEFYFDGRNYRSMTVCCINGSVNDAPKSTTAELINNLRQRQQATQIFVDTDQIGHLQRLCIFETLVPLKAGLLLTCAEVSNTLFSVKFKHNHVMTNFPETNASAGA